MIPKEAGETRLRRVVGRVFHRRDAILPPPTLTEPAEGEARDILLARTQEILGDANFLEQNFDKFVQIMFQVYGSTDGRHSQLISDKNLRVKIRISPKESVHGKSQIRVTDDLFHLKNDQFIPQFFERREEPLVTETIEFRSSSTEEPLPHVRYDYNIPPHCINQFCLSYITGETIQLPRDPDHHPAWVIPLIPKGQPISNSVLRDFCGRIVDLAEISK